MKKKRLILLLASAFLTGCKLEGGKCPQSVEVPFVKVAVPDSVPVGRNFTIDARLHDLGCYQSAVLYCSVAGDTVYLTAIAQYDECGCPEPSNDLNISRQLSLDTASGSTMKYFVYWQINSNKDSIFLCQDTVMIY
ncbi:MAG: hypothetical protein J6T12_08035 [Salinivirgaceae bacterium]|nr:hypothetical protein [Salinivirgaceae bacterium]